MTRLVLNADDLGLTGALSRSIVELRLANDLSDVSLLAVGDAFDESVTLLKRGGIESAGVHLCIVGGEAPLSSPGSVATLLAAGRFRSSWPRVLTAAVSGRIAPSEVEREWEAQIQRVIASGLRVTHLDGHQHLHLLPSLLPIAIRLAKRFQIPFVRAPRGDDPAAFGLPLSAVDRGRALLLSRLGSAARKRLAAAGLPPPPRLLGLAEAGRMTLPRLFRIIEKLPALGDFEIALHPGVADEATRRRYRWGYSWDEEALALRSTGLKELLLSRGIETVPFSAL